MLGTFDFENFYIFNWQLDMKVFPECISKNCIINLYLTYSLIVILSKLPNSHT